MRSHAVSFPLAVPAICAVRLPGGLGPAGGCREQRGYAPGLGTLTCVRAARQGGAGTAHATAVRRHSRPALGEDFRRNEFMFTRVVGAVVFFLSAALASAIRNLT